MYVNTLYTSTAAHCRVLYRMKVQKSSRATEATVAPSCTGARMGNRGQNVCPNFHTNAVHFWNQAQRVP